jgi:hypothetical protein
MEVENVGNNSCRMNVSWTNSSCQLPPDLLTVSWLIQKVISFDEVGQSMTLSTDVVLQWNDWRLKYVEGGFACRSASAGVLVASGLSAAAMAAPAQRAILAALTAAWGCSTPDQSCDGPFLPPGVLPRVTVTVMPAAPGTQANADALNITVFPAPPYLGFNDPNNVTATINAAILNISGITGGDYSPGSQVGGISGVAWTWVSVPCMGADARVTPTFLTMGLNMAAGQLSGTNDPTVTDPASFWTPEFEDSVNQLSDEQIISESWRLTGDGDLEHRQHFIVQYSLSMNLDRFPFDEPNFMATRRAINLGSDSIKVLLGTIGFAAPQAVEGWSLSNPGALVCNVHQADGDDTRLCDPAVEGLNSPACQDMVVLYFQASRNSGYWIQNMLAPIILVTILAATSYYNDLDAYEMRSGTMATSLLSQMALQAYVSSTLPQTVTITFIHCALYTSYALMGFGMGYIVIVSYGLDVDINAARRNQVANQVGKTAGDHGHHATDASDAHFEVAKKRTTRRMRRTWHRRRMASSTGEDLGCKHALLLAYYEEAATFRDLVSGKIEPDASHCGMIYFPRADEYARVARHRRASLTLDISAADVDVTPPEAVVTPSQRRSFRSSFSMDHEVEAKQPAANVHARSSEHRHSRRISATRLSSVDPKEDMFTVFAASADEEDGPAGVEPLPPPPLVPKMIPLRVALVQWDWCMRIAHLGVFCMVIGVRYFVIISMEAPTPTCNTLLNYFTVP